MARLRSPSMSRVQRNAPRQKLDWEYPAFGGLNDTDDPTGLDEIDSPDTLNTNYDSVQSVGTRKGYTKVLTTPAPSWIGGMYPLYQSNGTKQLVFGSNTNLYRYNNAGGSVALTGTPTNFTANQQWSFDELQDQVYGGNGTDPLISYNGTSYSIVNSAIHPQFLKVRKNRLYCANANSSTLYFSDAGNPASFPVNNFIQINTNDGQNITGLFAILDNLIIFKDDSVWILTGEPLGAGNTTTIGNLQLRAANSSVGCSAFRTIQQVDQTLFFMHYSGIYALQNYSVTLVSPKLQKTFSNGMNPGFLSLCWAVYNDQEKKYIMGYPSTVATTPDRAIVYDFLSKNYTRWDDIPGSCAINYRFSGLVEGIVMGDPNKGNIYQLLQGYADIAGDNGTATGGSTTTLVDSTKSWTTNIFADARVAIVTGAGQLTFVGKVVSNTATTLTFSSTATTPAAGQVYTIGYYDSYWTTKVMDFEMVGYTKKYRFFNLFIDSAIYPILFGSSIDFQPLNYQKAFKLSSNAPIWGTMIWGSFIWGSYSSLFAQASIAATGRYLQAKFGNNLANQPWRASSASVNYKLKKERPNIVTT